MAEFFSDDWDKLPPHDLNKTRARVQAFHDSTEDSNLKEQLRATIGPLFAAQDAILQLQEFFLTLVSIKYFLAAVGLSS